VATGTSASYYLRRPEWEPAPCSVQPSGAGLDDGRDQPFTKSAIGTIYPLGVVSGVSLVARP